MRRIASETKIFFAGLLVYLAGLLVSSASGQTSNLSYQVANLVEDVRVLSEQLQVMRIEMEEMRRENNRLRQRVADAESAVERKASQYVTSGRLSEELNEIVKQLESRDEKVRGDILVEVNKEMKKAMDVINEAMAGGGGGNKKPNINVVTDFNQDFPKTGISYIVQSGDTLSSIASKNKSTISWIQNANKIVDARLVQVGQRLFIPQKPN